MPAGWIDLPFTVVTPMFLARGNTGDGPESDGLRVPGIRAAAAWWFRAMAAPATAHGPQLLVLNRQVFGAAHGEADDQGPTFAMRLSAAPRLTTNWSPDWLDAREPGPGYLLGQGMYTPAGQGWPAELKRLPIDHGPAHGAGVLKIRNLNPIQRHALAASLWALSTLGGIGSRSRKCYGGIHFNANGLRELGLDPRVADGRYDPAQAYDIAADLRAVLGLGPVVMTAPSPSPALAPDLWEWHTANLHTDQLAKALQTVGNWYREQRTVPRPHKPGQTPRVTPEYFADIASWLAGAGTIERPYPFTTGGLGLPVRIKSAVIQPADRGDRWPAPFQIRLHAGLDGVWYATAHRFRTFPGDSMNLVFKQRHHPGVLTPGDADARTHKALADFAAQLDR